MACLLCSVVDATSDDAWEASANEATDGWLDVAIGLDVDGQRIDLLPILCDVGQRSGVLGDLAHLGPDDIYFLSLPDTGSTVAFPAARLQAIHRNARRARRPGRLRAEGTLRLPSSRAAVAARTRYAGIPRVRVPASFHGEPSAYQHDGLDWLQFFATYGLGGILPATWARESVQTLAHLLCEKEAGRHTRPALLVVPTSIVYNWRDEAARFAPSLRLLSLHGPGRAARFDDYDLVITTYALLVHDAVLGEREWHAVILDEAQALKNPLAKAAQVAARLRAIRFNLRRSSPQRQAGSPPR